MNTESGRIRGGCGLGGGAAKFMRRWGGPSENIGGGGNEDFQCLHMCVDLLELIENEDEKALEIAWAEEEMRL